MNTHNIHFLFPSDPLNFTKPDSEFQDQVEQLQSVGFKTSYYYDLTNKIYFPKNIDPGSTIVYRGWMMTPFQYEKLSDLVVSLGHKMFTTPEQYALCHHLPNWQPKIADLTAETHVYSETADLVAELTKLGWDKYFIKDYVKSLKTAPGSVANKPEDIIDIVAAMKKYRGCIEGGVCVRRFEKYHPDLEYRVFVLGGKAYEPGMLVPNEIINIVKECTSKIDSPFFTVDIAMRNDGKHRVVEIGDGQVSDLVSGWRPGKFLSMWVTYVNGLSSVRV
jgi:hypothetical protein